MGAPKSRQQMADELNQQLDERFQELEELNQALEQILRRRRSKRWQRSPLDPFTHLERFFEKLLDRVEQAFSRKR